VLGLSTTDTLWCVLQKRDPDPLPVCKLVEMQGRDHLTNLEDILIFVDKVNVAGLGNILYLLVSVQGLPR